MKLAGALLTVYVVWGSTYLAMAVADRTLPPLLMLAVRFGIAGALLLAWAWRRGELAVRPGRRELRAAAVVGAALLVASVPLFMAIVDRVWFGIRIPSAAAAGIATGLVGVAILAGPSGHTDLLGAAALLVASLSWAAGSAYMRVAPLPRGPLASAALQMTAAAVMLAVLGVATGEVGRVHPARISGESLAALAFLVLFGSLLAFTAYGWLVRHAPT